MPLLPGMATRPAATVAQRLWSLIAATSRPAPRIEETATRRRAHHAVPAWRPHRARAPVRLRRSGGERRQAAMAAQRTVHIVPHTHWDREWYEPFQRFRMRLVDLVDRVLDLAEADHGFAFTFDGQTAAVEDYLEVRPEAEQRLRRLTERGQLALGPWRILNDEFLVSGETIVRNLESGWRRAEALGGAMPVGYLPDQFGHVAQLPQVLRRAGLASAVLWRGVPAAIERHAFAWEAPDGSWVRAEYLPAGYVNAVPLLALPERLAERLALFERLMGRFYGDDDPLGMYGSDHSEPLPELVAVVDELNRSQDRYRMRIETLATYVAGQAGAADGELPRWRGEL